MLILKEMFNKIKLEVKNNFNLLWIQVKNPKSFPPLRRFNT